MAMLVQLIDDVVANKFELRQGTLEIGRGEGEPDTAAWPIDDAMVSRRHARIENRGSSVGPRACSAAVSW